MGGSAATWGPLLGLVLASTLLAISADSTVALAHSGAGTHYEYGFDGCSWYLHTNKRLADGGWSSVADRNGGCRYLTGDAQNAYTYVRKGPLLTEFLDTPNVDLPFYGRGYVTAWETDRYQNSGWKYQAW